ncbi:Two-component transcriptional response regulator, LuxR family [hydrothermal vent metagenome]|uniref:Two-component transcriptional response regulator, LuxR family n=1 Tax=hydrothermal vent metagenome TaxID=652676 RepID=A0A3B1B5B4_9ZZZZ
MAKELQRILYVEDEPDIQAVARIALETVGGFTVEICSSGFEAVEKASDFNPDLLLLDVMMPGMDGVSTLQELRKQPGLENTPAMFMTAKVRPSEVEQLRKEGAIDVIPKPFDPMTLSENLKSLWNKHTN